MLDIGVAVDADRMILVSEPTLALSDGYYWFLYPLIERLAEETEQYVDLYGDAVFAGGNLLALRRMLSEARGLVETRGESWEVRTGTQVVPVIREVYSPVWRDEFLRQIATWDHAAVRAGELGGVVVCVGD